ncbi:hypothetical protein VNO80_00933 [Phaseolus coccineus]|uniref:Uncharacterized protein n=1 Tax=Phaseolus coccineus TaxID=3886 RepID=A0AAN9P007_PHACN
MVAMLHSVGRLATSRMVAKRARVEAAGRVEDEGGELLGVEGVVGGEGGGFSSVEGVVGDEGDGFSSVEGVVGDEGGGLGRSYFDQLRMSLMVLSKLIWTFSV